MMEIISTESGAKSHDRMFGLDVCRTIAILPVVFGHMLAYSDPHPFIQSLGFLAIFGVDLFFCLSGFLIGRILLQDSTSWHETRENGVMHFWYRRWMRTLPLYFFYLFVNLNIYWGGGSDVISQAPYLLFAQNIAWPMTDFYRETWSLAVEEWFYFLFPLLILAWIGFGKNPRSAVRNTILLFILVPPVLRFVCFGSFGFDNMDPNIRHVVIFRMDSLGWGVLFAYLSLYHRELFDKVKSWKWLVIGLALVCIAFIRYGYFGLAESKFIVAAYFSIIAMVFAALIPFFTSLKPGRFRGLNRFITYTSLISYSLYLGHTPAFFVGNLLLRKAGIYDIVHPIPWLVYPLFFMLVYMIASLTYFLVEKPLLWLRDQQNAKGRTISKTIAPSVI